MKNLVSIVEIPTADFFRAVIFYQSVLNVKIEEVDMGEVHMGVLPSVEDSVSVVLVKGDDYKPSSHGSLVYLNAGNDIESLLKKIETSGGKIIAPKTEISPEMGFFALFADTEGNKLGLHATN